MEQEPFSKDSIIAASQSLKEKDYWSNNLRGDLENTRFSYDYNKRNSRERNLKEEKFRFKKETFEHLMKLSKASHPKLYMVLAAGLVTLIHKYTGTRDIIVCAPIYRQKFEADFINTILALRNPVEDSMTFKDILMQVRDGILEAVKNQNYPIANLLYDLNPSFWDGDNLHIDIAILLENIHEPQYLRHVSFNTSFCFKIVDGILELSLFYNSFCYEKTTIKRMIKHYALLLEEVLTDVNLQLVEINILSKEEKHQLLYDFNRTEAEYAKDRTIHELFEEQVEKTPGNIAVTYEKKHLSYSTLNESSNQLARVLSEKGVKPGTIVGIMVETSLEMIVGIIAIIKAAGTYLPIAIESPPQRVKDILNDSRACALLTRNHLVSNEETGSWVEIIDLDDEGISLMETYNPDIPCNPNDTAYVIYTSGSTGKPKGVMIEHQSILNYIQWKIGRFLITSADFSLQLVSVSFDGFCANLYPELLTGGKTVLLNQEKWRDVEHIRCLIQEERVTNFSLVPSMYAVLIDGANVPVFRTLRFIVLAGEKAGEGIIKLSQQLMPQVQLINEYGPTENSVAAAANFGMTPDNTSVIGTPISNNRILILDKNHQLIPIGAVGELCISGNSLARGYLNKPELTAEKFLFESSRFSRSYKSYVLYKTGDLARWLPDGNIELFGRIDNQVQVKGVRIEPGEIERQLQKHKDIKEVDVVAKKDKQGNKNLCD
jgi:amino acid adenylation domain-containing protein